MNGIGHKIIRTAETDSTNLHMHRLLEEGGMEEGTVLLAGYQRRGQGAARAAWHSEREKNLLFSTLLFPAFLPPASQFYLNKAFSLAVCDLVKEEVPEGVSIKWPNDIYFRKKKLAGMLFRNGITGDLFRYSIAGIGLNVNQEDFPAELPNPVSLRIITGKLYDLDALLDRLLGKLEKRYRQLEAGGVGLIDQAYSESLYLIGVKAKYRYKGKRIDATIRGVNDFGFLQLDTDEIGRLECDLKEVEYLL